MLKSSRRLAQCHNIDDLRLVARRRLPHPIFQMLEGGAEDERTLRRNRAAFDEALLVPRTLVDVSQPSTRVRLLGHDLSFPLICSPTGASRLFDNVGEVAVARAASTAGLLYMLSGASTCSLADVAAAASGPKIFQLYVRKDRGYLRETIERCRQAKFDALCVTVDVPVVGKRERDLRTGFGTSPKWTLSSLASFFGHPRWIFQRMGRGALALANVGNRAIGARALLDATLDWNDLAEISELWDGPLVVKGIMSPADARRAAELGVAAIMVSNHGGRQLDGAASPLDVLPAVVDAVGGRSQIILDGGIRRGTHILKALALGATACAIGRPYLYGLAAGGEAGVMRALDILREEFVAAMQLSGCNEVRHVDRSLLLHAQPARVQSEGIR